MRQSRNHSTFNTQHSTLRLLPQSFNIQHSTLNIQHSTLRLLPQSFNTQHSTLNIQNYCAIRRNNFELLVTYSLNGVELCSLLGWIPSEEDASEGTHGETHDDAPRLNAYWPMCNEVHGIRYSHAKKHTNESTCDAKQDCLDKKLVEDVDTTRTNTHAKTNLASALRDAHIHDVHDAYAAHNERDASHTAKQDGQHVGGRVHHARQLLLRTYIEVVRVGLGGISRVLELMRASQDLRYLLRCLIGHTLGYCRAGDAPKICLCKSASSTSATTCISLRFCAMVNSSGVEKLAATV